MSAPNLASLYNAKHRTSDNSINMESKKMETGRIGPVLVIGGSGFLGSCLVRALLEDPIFHSIDVLDLKPLRNQHDGAMYHKGSISYYPGLLETLSQLQPQVIFHLAAPPPNASAEAAEPTNILGTQNLLKCVDQIRSIRAIIYTSSHHAIELSPANSLLTEETSKLHTSKSSVPESHKSKGIAEAMILSVNSPQLKTASLRIPEMYGAGDPYFTTGLLDMMKQGKHNMQIGRNEKVFEHIYVENAVQGHVLAAKTLFSSRAADGQAFFLTDGKPLPWYSFARKVWHAAGDRTEPHEIRKVSRGLVLSTARMNEISYAVCSFGSKKPKVGREEILQLERGTRFDIEKARTVLGYEPVEGMPDRGISEAVESILDTPEKRRAVLRRQEP